MELNKLKIREFVELLSKTCDEPHLTKYDVSGINRNKEFFEPSNQVGNDTSSYKVVPPKYFACNLMHVGRDVVLPVAINNTTKNKIVSPAYTVFKIKDGIPLLKEYFFMILNSEEKDRLFWFHTDSSVRDGMSWGEFCDIEIELPSLEIQQKYVDVYSAMVENQKCYEAGLDDLKLTCDAYIEELRRNSKCEKIGPYIKQLNKTNINGEVSLVLGVVSSGNFEGTRANLTNVDLSKYQVIEKRNIAYNPSRINVGSIALYNGDEKCVISPMYIAFDVVDEKILSPEYLMMWYKRDSFSRYTYFYSIGSVRDTFDFELMKEFEIPIPDIKVQESIANIYKVLQERKAINEQLKAKIKEICPILIKGSLEEAITEDMEVESYAF